MEEKDKITILKMQARILEIEKTVKELGQSIEQGASEVKKFVDAVIKEMIDRPDFKEQVATAIQQKVIDVALKR